MGVALAVVLLSNCETNTSPAESAIRVDPPWVALLLGDSASFAVIPLLDTVPGPATWTISNRVVATVSPDGVVHGRAHGVVTVSAHTAIGSATAIVVVAPPVLVGAGDIAQCGAAGDEATAALLDRIPGVVFAGGDNAYPDGATAEYTRCYAPSWGRHRARTRPVPGNHDYQTPGATGYFAYFGPLAGQPGVGYYSWDFAGWHMVSLNSNIPMDPGTPQEQWLRADLAAHPALCTLALWHHALFSSDEVRRTSASRPLFRALYEGGADLLIVGHSHTYERFAPQDPDGRLDPAAGIRQFVAGTGGRVLHAFDMDAPNSEARNSASFGVLKLTLRPDGYEWQFLSTPPVTFTDVGSGNCH